MRFWTILAIFCLFFASCSDKYQAFRSRYQFKSPDGRPDYANLNFWAAHPAKWDPSDSIPAPLRSESRDTLADVFFLYPTSFTMKDHGNKMTADIDDDYLNAKTDYSSILYQASAFNQHARVFAPRYRQVHISTFYMKQDAYTDSLYEIAYADIKTAFQYYLDHWNNGRPFIIAGHSQGSKMGERLLKEMVEGTPLQERMIAAYVPGWSLPKEMFSSIKVCTDAQSTGCICSWRTFRNGYQPLWMNTENGNSYVTNPLNWSTGAEHAPRSANKGAVLLKFNKVYKHSTDGRIANGVLYVKKPKFPWSFLYRTKNYHVGDINLFYLNVRENVETRINAWFAQHAH